MYDSNLVWRIHYDMVVITLELVSLVTLSSGILYVSQELIKPMDGFVNQIRSSVKIHLGLETQP